MRGENSLITQLKYQLEGPENLHIDSSWGYWFYAALMEHIPDEMAEMFHLPDRTPINQHLRISDREKTVHWVVNILGDEAEQCLLPHMDSISELKLRECTQAFKLVLNEKRNFKDANAFWNRAAEMPDANLHRLCIMTPTAFRSNRRYVVFPDIRLILQSLMLRWNSIAPSLRICDEDVLQMMEMQIWLRDYRLQTRRFELKGQAVPGFCGTIWLQNSLPAPLLEIWKGLLLFCEYSGLGIKTALGMGAVELSNPKRK